MHSDTNKQRRQVLKGMAAGGALVSSASLWASVAQANVKHRAAAPLYAVISPDAAGKRFLAGINAKRATPLAAQQVLHSSTQMPFITQLQALLADKQPKRLVALVDDASATLIIDLARDVSAHLVWQEHHTEAGGHYVSFLLEA